MNKLIKLKNGDWIDPSDRITLVFGEEIIPDGTIYSSYHKPRAIIDINQSKNEWSYLGSCRTIIIDFETEQAAKQYMDDLAWIINDQRSKI